MVIVPCGVTASLAKVEEEKLMSACEEIRAFLAASGIRVKADLRDNYSPGWKFNHWELKVSPSHCLGMQELIYYKKLM